jgi:hypothetical protein
MCCSCFFFQYNFRQYFSHTITTFQHFPCTGDNIYWSFIKPDFRFIIFSMIGDGISIDSLIVTYPPPKPITIHPHLVKRETHVPDVPLPVETPP